MLVYLEMRCWDGPYKAIFFIFSFPDLGCDRPDLGVRDKEIDIKVWEAGKGAEWKLTPDLRSNDWFEVLKP